MPFVELTSIPYSPSSPIPSPPLEEEQPPDPLPPPPPPPNNNNNNNEKCHGWCNCICISVISISIFLTIIVLICIAVATSLNNPCSHGGCNEYLSKSGYCDCSCHGNDSYYYGGYGFSYYTPGGACSDNPNNHNSSCSVNICTLFTLNNTINPGHNNHSSSNHNNLTSSTGYSYGDGFGNGYGPGYCFNKTITNAFCSYLGAGDSVAVNWRVVGFSLLLLIYFNGMRRKRKNSEKSEILIFY